jgi:hypothetical protein
MMAVDVKNKSKYLFTLRFPFEAFDNLDARLSVRMLLEKLGLEGDKEVEKKLQKVFRDKAPEKVNL